MDCLDNYIGLKNCALPEPDSGLYVNILPGIKTELVDKIASSEQINFNGVWGDVKQRAFLRLKNDIIMKIQERVDFNDIVYQTKNLTLITEQLIPVLSGSEYRGIYVRIPTTKYAQYYIDTLQVYSDAITTTVVKVFDVNDGSELYLQSIDLVVGLNTISINKYFELRYGNLELFIGVDCENFNSVETYQEDYYWYDQDFDCATPDSWHGQRNFSLQINPATIDKSLSPVYTNIYRTSVGSGISVVSQIKCSIDVFICQNRKQFEQAILYLLGAEILMEKMGSPRLNFFTVSNIENTEYFRLLFEKRYTDNISRAMKTIPLEGEGFCFHCGEQASVQYKGFMI